MTLAYHTLLPLLLIVLQTVAFPGVTLLTNFFDLTVTFVIYLGLLRPARESLPMIVILGGVMDNLSGTPFMLYVATYIWVYLLVCGLTQMLHVGMRFRLAVIVSLAVLVQNIIFVLWGLFFETGAVFPGAMAKKIIVPVLWAACIGPLLIILYDRFHGLWMHVVAEIVIKRFERAGRKSA